MAEEARRSGQRNYSLFRSVRSARRAVTWATGAGKRKCRESHKPNDAGQDKKDSRSISSASGVCNRIEKKKIGLQSAFGLERVVAVTLEVGISCRSLPGGQAPTNGGSEAQASWLVGWERSSVAECS